MYELPPSVAAFATDEMTTTTDTTAAQKSRMYKSALPTEVRWRGKIPDNAVSSEEMSRLRFFRRPRRAGSLSG